MEYVRLNNSRWGNESLGRRRILPLPNKPGAACPSGKQPASNGAKATEWLRTSNGENEEWVMSVDKWDISAGIVWRRNWPQCRLCRGIQKNCSARQVDKLDIWTSFVTNFPNPPKKSEKMWCLSEKFTTGQLWEICRIFKSCDHTWKCLFSASLQSQTVHRHEWDRGRIHAPGVEGARCLSFLECLPSLAKNPGGRTDWYWYAPPTSRRASEKSVSKVALRVPSRVHGPGTRWSTHEGPGHSGTPRTAEGGSDSRTPTAEMLEQSRDGRGHWSWGCGRQRRSGVKVSHRQRATFHAAWTLWYWSGIVADGVGSLETNLCPRPITYQELAYPSDSCKRTCCTTFGIVED